jgi:hypothetical protein
VELKVCIFCEIKTKPKVRLRGAPTRDYGFPLETSNKEYYAYWLPVYLTELLE